MEASPIAAEALLAVTGIFPEDPLTPKDGKLAETTEKRWRAEISAFFDQMDFRKFKAAKVPDHEKTLDRLIKPLDPRERSELVSLLAIPELGEAYLMALVNARNVARAAFSMLQMDSITGPIDLPPGVVEQGKSSAILSVVDDPDRVLDEIRSGTLTRPQAAAFKAAYPELLKMLSFIIWDIAQKRGKAAPVSFDKQRVLRLLVGLPPQGSLSKAQQQPTAKAPPAIKIDFDKLKTRAQVLAAR